MQTEFNQPTSQQESNTKSNKLKKTGLILLVLLLVIGAGAISWYVSAKQVREENTKELTTLNARITDLEKQVTQKAVVNTEVNSKTQLENDVEQIDKALLAACNKDATTPQKYLVGNSEKITATYLTTANGDSQRYARGFAQISIGCRSISPTQEEGGGYVSFLQRQTNGTWKEIFGTQEELTCSTVNKYKIPKEIVPSCSSEDSTGPLIKNTN